MGPGNEGVGAGHAPPANPRQGLGWLDLFVPRRCAACGRGEKTVCADCLAALVLLRGPLCRRCGAPTAWPVQRCSECAGRRLAFTNARAAVAYEGAGRALVIGWKERGLRSLAGLFADLVEETVPRPTADALVFVPAERDRSLWRGHNPAEALAAALATRWRLRLVPALCRTRPMGRQTGLPRTARRANVQGAFRAFGVPPEVALVDDVYTTGATVSAAATALRRSGARVVHVVTFARATR
jgi:predicted amidophosphoribosyltransferase